MQLITATLADDVDLVGAVAVFRGIIFARTLNSWMASCDKTTAGVLSDVSSVDQSI